MKLWHLILTYMIAGLISIGLSLGAILLVVWLGVKIVKAVW